MLRLTTNAYDSQWHIHGTDRDGRLPISSRTWWPKMHDIKNKSSAVAEMGDRLATIDMGRKVAALLYLFPWASWVPI